MVFWMAGEEEFGEIRKIVNNAKNQKYRFTAHTH